MKKNIFLLGLSLLLVSCNVNNPTENNSIDPSIENSKEEVSPTEEASPDLSYLSGKLNSSEYTVYFDDGNYQTTKNQYYYHESGDVSKIESTIIDESGSILLTINSEYEYKDGYLWKLIKRCYIDTFLSEYSYEEFDSNGNSIISRRLAYIDEQTLVSGSCFETLCEYDDQNNLIKSVWYNYLDINTKYKYYENTYELDGLNRKETINYYNVDGTMNYYYSGANEIIVNEHNDLLSSKVYDYNDNNELYLSSHVYYEYDEHYNKTMVGRISYDRQGNVGYTRIQYVSYEYDENNNVIKTEEYEYDENNYKINVYYSEYEYDSNNNVVVAKHFKVIESVTYLTNTNECEYDSNGNKIKTINTYFDEEGNITYTNTIISEYDENNNCIYYKHIQNNDSYSYQISKYDENNNLIEYSSYDNRDGEEKLYSYMQYIYFE